MSFSNELFLWALAACVIPLIIHLFYFRKIKVVVFSDVSLLRNVKEASRSRRRIKEWLVLLLRVLAIAFFVVALASPFILKNDIAAVKNRALFLDNSVSMGYSENGILDFLAIEKKQAIDLITSIGNDQLVLSTIDQTQSTSRISHKRALGKVEELKVSYDKSDIPLVLERWDGYTTELNDRWIFSDFQHFDEQDFNQIGATNQYHFVYMGNGDRMNVFVDSVWLEKDDDHSVLNIDFGVSNTSIGNRLVRVIMSEQLVTSFSTNDSTDVYSVILRNDAIEGAYAIELEDQFILADNVFRFVIRKPERKLIYHLNGDEPTSAFKSVFGDSIYFEYVSDKINNVDSELLDQSSLVILDDLENRPVWLTSSFLSNHDVLIIPDPIQFDFDGLIEVKPAEAEATLINGKSLNHPLFEGVFNKLDANAQLPSFTRSYDVKGNYDLVLGDDTNHPVLLRLNSGEYLFTGSLLNKRSTLTNHSLFLPLMYKIALSDDAYDIKYYWLDQKSINIHSGGQSFSEVLTLSNADVNYQVPVYQNSKGLTIELPNDLSPGYFYLMDNTDTLEVLGLNVPKYESTYDKGTLDLMRDYFAQLTNVEVISFEEMGAKIRDESNEDTFPLWKYALILALIALGLEMVLLRFIK